MDGLDLLNHRLAESSGFCQVDGGKQGLCIYHVFLLNFILAYSVPWPQLSLAELLSRSLFCGSRSWRQGSVGA